MANLGAFYGKGKFGRVFPVRLKTNTDVITGLLKVCLDSDIKYGAVLYAIGSLRKLTYQVLDVNPKDPLGASYGAPIQVPGPIELISAHGSIFQSDGKTALHLHGTFSDKTGNAFGGHVVAGGNPVLATLEAVIGEIDGVEILRQPDAEAGRSLYTPQGFFVATSG